MFYFLYCCSITVVPIFHPVLPPQTTHTRLPHSILPTPIVIVHESFIHIPGWPFPVFAPLVPSPHPSGYCQFVLYFHVSGYILLPFFVDSVSLIGEIIWYLSFTTWLISLSIMFPSFIRVLMKGRKMVP